MASEQTIRDLLARVESLERSMANLPVRQAEGTGGIVKAFLGKVTKWEKDIVSVAPMHYGDPDKWDTALFGDEICGLWSGVGTLTPPGTVVVCLRLTNAFRMVAIPLYNLVGDWVVGPEFKACEPDAADLADPDTSTCPLPAFDDINCLDS